MQAAHSYTDDLILHVARDTGAQDLEQLADDVAAVSHEEGNPVLRRVISRRINALILADRL